MGRTKPFPLLFQSSLTLGLLIISGIVVFKPPLLLSITLILAVITSLLNHVNKTSLEMAFMRIDRFFIGFTTCVVAYYTLTSLDKFGQQIQVLALLIISISLFFTAKIIRDDRFHLVAHVGGAATALSLMFYLRKKNIHHL